MGHAVKQQQQVRLESLAGYVQCIFVVVWALSMLEVNNEAM